MKQLKYKDIIWLIYWKYKIIEDLWMFNGKRFVLCSHIEKWFEKRVNFYDLKNWKINWDCHSNKHCVTHWDSKTLFYEVWKWINARCNNKNHKSYSNYGWRGIKCEWETFEEFKNDMYEWYKKWLQIDRRDNDWNYCKNNCKWSTLEEQANNKRSNRKITYNWKTMNLSEWAKELWIKRSTLSARINTYKYSIELAFNLS